MSNLEDRCDFTSLITSMLFLLPKPLQFQERKIIGGGWRRLDYHKPSDPFLWFLLFCVDVYIVFSIVCFFPCAFSFEVASSLTSLFVRRPDFLGFSGGISPSSFS
jgi:hypothetical protein